MTTISSQPNLVIAVLGHVANGKSTLVRQITGIRTQKHSSEITGQTKTLGYVNVKLFGCSNCDAPKKYQFRHSTTVDTKCDDSRCDGVMTQLLYISFLDCPGHNYLMETVLSGTSVMHACIIVEDASSDTIPAPQTLEHLQAVDMLKIPILFTCMNKIDLITKKQTLVSINNLKKTFKTTLASNCPIIPISASHFINFDIIAEYMYKLTQNLSTPSKTSSLKMLCVRSFNNNKQDTNLNDLIGGSLGGSILQGTIKTGDKIEILPGIVRKNLTNKTIWDYLPLYSTVEEIYTDTTKIDMALPGGLISIRTELDPALTAKDRIVGSTITHIGDESSIQIYESLVVKIDFINNDYIIKNGYTKLSLNNIITLNCSAAKTNAKIINLKKKKNLYELELLDRPICCYPDTIISISRKIGDGGSRLIGIATIKAGSKSNQTTFEEW